MGGKELYSNLLIDNNAQSIIYELIENIADKIVERVKQCYCNQKSSIVTISDVKKIVIKQINEYAQIKDLDVRLLRNKLIIELDSDCKNFYEDLASEAIYNTDYQMAELERDKEHFFSRESLLSENPEYNEELRKKVAKAMVVGVKYVSDVDQGIYIIDRGIKELDLSTDKSVKKLDFRRLRRCRYLNKIKLGPHLNSISHLEDIITYGLKIKIDYYCTPYSMYKDVIDQIVNFQNNYEDDFSSIFV